MSSLYLRGRSVWIKFKDQFGVSHRRATGYQFAQRPRLQPGISSPRWPGEVLDFQKRLDREIHLGTWGLQSPHRSPRLSGWLEEYLSTVVVDRAASTKRDYRRAVRTLIDFAGDLPLTGYQEDQLLALRALLLKTRPSASVSKLLRSLAALFTAAVERRHLERSPINRRHNVQIKLAPPRPFLPAEIDQFLRAVRNVDPALAHHCQFSLLSGFRSDEICRLTWDDVSLDELAIYVRNDKEHRVDPFPVDEALLAFLKDLPRSYSPYVFRYRNITTISHKVRRILDDLGMDPRLNFHALRKTFARNVIAATNNIQVAQELCRHRSLSTTLKHYSWFSLDEKRAALSRTRRQAG